MSIFLAFFPHQIRADGVKARIADGKAKTRPAKRTMKTTKSLILAASVVLGASASLAQTNFTKITNSPIGTNAANTEAVCWVDFDGDGNLDLFVTSYDGPNLLYRNDGEGVFTRITTGNVETLRIEWPSGTVQEFQNLEGRKYLTVTEPSLVVPTSADHLQQFSLEGGRNMRYGIQTSTNLTDWSFLTMLTITNFNGTALITDTNAPVSDRHFYRTVLR